MNFSYSVLFIYLFIAPIFVEENPSRTPPHCTDTMMKLTKQRGKTKKKYICNFCFTFLFCQYHILCLDLRLLFRYPLVPHPPLISPSSLRLHVCIIFQYSPPLSPSPTHHLPSSPFNFSSDPSLPFLSTLCC